MKKFLCILSICLLSVFAFAGCEAEGAKDVAGIKFVRDVFYVDKNVKTFLDYKVYPDTAQDYYVTFRLVDADSSQDRYYDFSKGYVTVTHSNFESIKVSATINDYSDVCEVRLREYPRSVFFNETEEMIDAGTAHSLNLRGLFNDGERVCANGEFVYEITSSDPSVIEIVDSESLLVRSTGRRGSSTINVQICNGVGEKLIGLSASIRLDVVETIKTSYATFGELFIVENVANSIQLVAPQNSEHKIDVKYFDEQGYLIDVAEFELFVSNDVFEVVENQDGKFIKIKHEGVVELTIQSKNISTEGKVLQIKRTIQVQFL